MSPYSALSDPLLPFSSLASLALSITFNISFNSPLILSLIFIGNNNNIIPNLYSLKCPPLQLSSPQTASSSHTLPTPEQKRMGPVIIVSRLSIQQYLRYLLVCVFSIHLEIPFTTLFY